MAAPKITPANTPISKPPTFDSKSRPSAGLGALTSSAFCTTAVLRRSSSGERPVPCPVVSPGGTPAAAAVIAADAVVLPMPISPVAMRSAPAAAVSAAKLIPASRHCPACSRDIAGPALMSSVPGPILMERSSGCGGSGAATPASTMTCRIPKRRHITLIAAPPDRKLSTIWAVTACG